MPRKGKSAELARWLGERRPARIGEPEFAQLLAALAPISESYLRRLVRDCAVPLDPMVEGVRQSTLDELDLTLAKLFEEYAKADTARRMAVRRIVIAAKDHARLAARNPGRRAQKEETILWLTTWLENPPLFGEWVKIRRGVREISGGLLRP